MAAWEYFTSQKQWESYLKDLVRTNDQALLRAIVLIYDNQTDEEKLEAVDDYQQEAGRGQETTI